MGSKEGFLPGKTLQGPIQFQTPFPWIFLKPEGNRDGRRKVIKFCLERLMINLARELSFGGLRDKVK